MKVLFQELHANVRLRFAKRSELLMPLCEDRGADNQKVSCCSEPHCNNQCETAEVGRQPLGAHASGLAQVCFREGGSQHSEGAVCLSTRSCRSPALLPYPTRTEVPVELCKVQTTKIHTVVLSTRSCGGDDHHQKFRKTFEEPEDSSKLHPAMCAMMRCSSSYCMGPVTRYLFSCRIGSLQRWH